MWSIEDVLSELKEEERKKEKSGGLPPGFRFHPTDEELITFYLASKVFTHPPPPPPPPPPSYPNLPTLPTSTSLFAPPVDIPEVDLNRCEPWDLPERAKMGEREWYFYSVRDRKYPTGLRTNRATGSGYWKATGKDRHVYATASSSNLNNKNNNCKKKKSIYNYHDGDHELALIGMKKTLVFYQGRAPRGLKTPWVMHEYRLDGHFSSFRLSSSKEEWVICRIFHKHGGSENKKSRASPTNYINNYMINSCLPPLLENPTTTTTTCSPPLPSLPSYFSPPSFLHPTTTATAAAAPPPPSSAIFDDFPQLPQCPDEDSLPSLSAIGMTMKQENNQHNWLDKIIAPHHQLIHLNPNYYDHHNALGDLADDDKFGDVLYPTNFGAPDCFSDHVEMCASLAAAAALDRLLDHPPVYQPLSN